MTGIFQKKSGWLVIIDKLTKERIGDPLKLEQIKKKLNQEEDLSDDQKEYLMKNYESIQQFSEDNSPTNNLRSQTLQSEENPDSSENDYFNQTSHRIEELKGEIHALENQISGYDSAKLTPKLSILIDEYEPRPTANFESLSLTIANLVRSSNPHFTIGIYGDWGTGKTTLMRAVERNLNQITKGQEPKVLTIWFNAWKYERDQETITQALFKALAYKMSSHRVYNRISKTIFKSLKFFDKELVKNIQSENLPRSRHDFDKILSEKSKFVSKLQRDSIYFDGVNKIQRQMKEIRRSRGDEFRIAVFVDDLDRCSPVRVLEVLESIKLFLDIEGFVFIIGLSHQTITKLISNEYQMAGVKGEDYIKKIIQIPITIPRWNESSIIELLETRICGSLTEEYSKFLRQNPAMIAQVVNYNPRQLKRFINNVIIAFESFAKYQNSNVILEEIFLIHLLKSKWPKFYYEYIKNEEFREIVTWMLTKPKQMQKYFNYIKAPEEIDLSEQKIKRHNHLLKLVEHTGGLVSKRQIESLVEFDYNSWLFFENVREVMAKVKDWNLLDNMISVVEDINLDLENEEEKKEQ